MDQSWGLYAKWDKLTIKGQLLNDSTYMTYTGIAVKFADNRKWNGGS